MTVGEIRAIGKREQLWAQKLTVPQLGLEWTVCESVHELTARRLGLEWTVCESAHELTAPRLGLEWTVCESVHELTARRSGLELELELDHWVFETVWERALDLVCETEHVLDCESEHELAHLM